MVLELARPSEAWGFPPGGELAFQRFEWCPLQFFGVVLDLARPSEAGCFPPGGDFL